MGGSTKNFKDKEDLESIQSDVSDMSEDLENVISPLNADPYGTTNLERRIIIIIIQLCFRLIVQIYKVKFTKSHILTSINI